MKYWPVHLLVFVLLVSIAYAEPKEEEIELYIFTKEQVQKIRAVINELLLKIEKLEGDNKRLRNTSGCS